MLDDVLQWMRAHPVLLTTLFVASLVMVLVGLLLVPVIIARLPADHFVREGPRPGSFRDRHPAVRVTLLALKNAFGVFLVLAGVAMLVLPGQGILTILLGLAFLDLPGKDRAELWIVRQPPVRKAIDWIRQRANQPPLQLPPAATGD